MILGLKELAKSLPGPVRQLARAGYIAARRTEIAVQTYLWAAQECARYLRHQNGWGYRFEQRRHLAQITLSYHSLEKGLSIANPRPGFGLAPAVRLAGLIESYLDQYPYDEEIRAAVGTLESYLAFQRSHAHDLPLLTARVGALVEAAPQPLLDAERGGVELVSGEAPSPLGSDVFERFLLTRHSVRHFADRPVSAELLRRAVAQGQLSPSACNRQGARAYCFTEKGRVGEILKLQPGNRGWGHTVPAVMVITAAVDVFGGPGERRQCFIDGGLFAMTTVLALHALGLGTCMLAWSVSPSQDQKMRRLAGVPDSEEIIMLVAVGHMPEALRVPVSKRLNSSNVAFVHEGEATGDVVSA